MLSTDDQTLNQDSPEAIWNLQWRHLFSSSTFVEVKYTGWWGYYYLDPKVNVPLSLDAHDGLVLGRRDVLLLHRPHAATR